MIQARRLLGWLGTAELFVAVAAFVLVVALSVLQIVLRSVFATSIVWAQEIAQLGMLVSYFLGAAYVYKQRQYMVVDFFVRRFPPRAQYLLYLLAQALTLTFAAIMVAMLLEIAPAQLRMKTFVLHIPRFYSSLPVMIGSLSLALTALYFAVATVRSRRIGGPYRPIDEIEAAANPVDGRPPHEHGL